VRWSAAYNARMEAAEEAMDRILGAADRALRALFAPAHASRPLPVSPTPAAGTLAPAAPETGAAPPALAEGAGPALSDSPLPSPPGQSGPVLPESGRRVSAALMRVNHAGEIAAQALYHGQAFAARSRDIRELMLAAAREESDHLAWCETRLGELHSRPSLLNPLWYAGSFAIGALAAVSGNRTSLGFVVETEKQVERHLDEHLERLPEQDGRSRAILQQMRADEIAHGRRARSAGAVDLPVPVRMLMRHTARLMTRTAYFI